MSSANKLPISVPYVSTKRDSGFATPRGWEQCAAHCRQSPSRSRTCVTKRREKKQLGSPRTWRDVEHLEHGLLHALSVGLGVHRSIREHDGMFHGHNPELVEENVVPEFSHVIPVRDEIVRDGILQSQDTALVLRLVTNIIVLLGRRSKRDTTNEFSHGGRLPLSHLSSHNKNMRNALEQNTLSQMATDKLLELVLD